MSTPYYLYFIKYRWNELSTTGVVSGQSFGRATNPIYMDALGSDTNNGSVNSPVRTLYRAAQLAGIQGKDGIHINPGHYNDQRDYHLDSSGPYDFSPELRNVIPSGTPSKPFYIIKTPGSSGEVVFDGDTVPFEYNEGGTDSERPWFVSFENVTHMEMRDLRFTNGAGKGLAFRNCSNVSLINCESDHHHSDGIYINGGEDYLIQNCDLHHCAFVKGDKGSTTGDGLKGTGLASRITVRGCKVYANLDDGVDVFNTYFGLIENNLIYSNGKFFGVRRADNSLDIRTTTDNQLIGVTGDGSGIKAGGLIQFNDASKGHTHGRHLCRNNVIIDHSKAGINSNNGGENVYSGNTMIACATAIITWVGEDASGAKFPIHTLSNNVAINCNLTASGYTSRQVSNSWNIGISNPAVESIDPTQPNVGRPIENGNLINRGNALEADAAGVAYEGSNPDLGGRQRNVPVFPPVYNGKLFA